MPTIVLFLVAVLLTGCMAWKPYKAYEGEERPAAKLASVRTYGTAGNNFEYLDQVRRGPDLVFDANQHPWSHEAREIRFQPGEYEITLTGRCSHKDEYTSATYSARLKPGHVYAVSQGCCPGLAFWKLGICLWLEDTATAEDVTASRQTVIR